MHSLLEETAVEMVEVGAVEMEAVEAEEIEAEVVATMATATEMKADWSTAESSFASRGSWKSRCILILANAQAYQFEGIWAAFMIKETTGPKKKEEKAQFTEELLR